MLCEQTILELKAYADGELTGLPRWRVRRHLAHCPDCAAQFAGMQRLYALLIAADVVPQAMSAEPARFSPQATRKGSTRMALKLLCGVAAAAGLALALLTLPASHHTRSMAAEIRHALEDVNTWHLRGWKLQNGKPIPWEVWGRRTPFFYREQVGQDVVVDDGKRRISLFAPLKSVGSRGVSPGILLKTPSMPQEENVQWTYHRWSYYQMVTQWQREVKPWAQAAEGPVFNFGESGVFDGGEVGSVTDRLYTVDRNTWLPVRFEARLGKDDRKRTIATLTVDYNAPIPANLIQLPTAAPGYQVYDTTQSVSPPPKENAATQQSITIQIMPLLMDANGNILARVKGWMGNLLIGSGSPMQLDVSVDRWADSNPDVMKTPATTDDQQRPYVEVNWEATRWGNADPNSRLLLLSPAEPIAQDAPRPTSLTLRLGVSVNMNTRLSGTLGMGDSQLSAHEFLLTIPLPASPSSNFEQSAYAYLDRNWRKRNISADGYENLLAATDYARALFYGAIVDTRHPDREHLERSTQWHEQYLRHSSCPGASRLDHLFLAQLYSILGNKARAWQLLKEAIEESRSTTKIAYPITMTPAQRKQMEAENRHIEAMNLRNYEESLRRLEKYGRF